MSAEQRLAALGLELPPSSEPAGHYASAVQSGALVYFSGKAPRARPDEGLPKGKLGREFDTAAGYELARSACLELLAAIRSKLGSLDAVGRIVELHGAINAEPDFEDHAEVLDGASDLLVSVFGEAGLHARSVIGVSSLRKGVPLTVRATVELRRQP